MRRAQKFDLGAVDSLGSETVPKRNAVHLSIAAAAVGLVMVLGSGSIRYSVGLLKPSRSFHFLEGFPTSLIVGPNRAEWIRPCGTDRIARIVSSNETLIVFCSEDGSKSHRRAGHADQEVVESTHTSMPSVASIIQLLLGDDYASVEFLFE